MITYFTETLDASVPKVTNHKGMQNELLHVMRQVVANRCILAVPDMH